MKKERIFHLEDLDITVPLHLDEYSGKHLYDYPIYYENLVYTGFGHLCVNAFQEACEHIKPSDGITVKNMDCGCCIFYKPEQKKDLIGVCMCERNMIQTNDVKKGV